MNDYEPIIVVVDPDADRATALSSELDRKGYHVFRRSSGIDALECVVEYRPELVLSEIELPDFERPELLRSIQEASPSTRVLFVQRHGEAPAPSEAQADPLANLEILLEAVDEIAPTIDALVERYSPS